MQTSIQKTEREGEKEGGREGKRKRGRETDRLRFIFLNWILASEVVDINN